MENCRKLTTQKLASAIDDDDDYPPLIQTVVEKGTEYNSGSCSEGQVARQGLGQTKSTQCNEDGVSDDTSDQKDANASTPDYVKDDGKAEWDETCDQGLL